jgi:hypothetical protein
VYRALIGAATLVLALAAVVGVLVLLGSLPSGTHASSLIVRAIAGLGIGLVIVVVVRRMLSTLADAPPAPPEKVDARGADLVYECAVCGMRVRLEVATLTTPPRHCGEAMEAKIS